MAKNVGLRRPEPAKLPLAGISAECLDALLQANARAAQLWVNTWMKMTAEVGAFATKRWSHDAELLGRLCSCKSAVDVVELQAAFAERVLKDYIRETVKLTDMEMEAATEEMAEMGKGARAATEIVTTSGPPARPARKGVRAH